MVIALALGFPHISVTLKFDGKVALQAPGEKDPAARAAGLFGKNFAAKMLKEQLDLRYFTPEITRIFDIKTEYGYGYFHVMTTYGECRFTIHNGGSSVTLFAVLAIVIALMGVFGIVMFETQHRRSEIAVRKVYGATTSQIVKLLNLRYVWIVGGCFVVAAPVAWYITSRWLEQFANRIAQPWWLYIAALAVVLAVTVGLVTLRSWKAATENPADVVKGN